MKILFIVPYPSQGPSNRYRVEQYLPFLREKGVIYALSPFYCSSAWRIFTQKGNYLLKGPLLIYFWFMRLKDVFRALFYDVVFIHREACPLGDHFFETLLRMTAKKVIYDFDDSVFLKKPLKIKSVIRSSNTVIAGNRYLQDYAWRYNKNVKVLPTCIDTFRYMPRGRSEKKERLVIGWIGTPSTSVYLDSLRDVFRAVASKYSNVEFVFVGARFEDGHLPVRSYAWKIETEREILGTFDIGIMPLFNDDWAKGKCGFKIIQYMAMGIPAVASAVGMNFEIIEDASDGFLVKDDPEWISRLSLLITDEKLRNKIGLQGRKKVTERYSLDVNREKFLGIIEKTYAKE